MLLAIKKSLGFTCCPLLQEEEVEGKGEGEGEGGGGGMASYPPLIDHYGAFLSTKLHLVSNEINNSIGVAAAAAAVAGSCDLPTIDISSLLMGKEDEVMVEERKYCVAAMSKAASEWGFFRVVNHGISHELLEDMRREEKKVFELPFEKKITNREILNEAYRWGAPSATSLNQFSWSEAYHVPLSLIFKGEDDQEAFDNNSFWKVMYRFATSISKLAQLVAGVLAENVGHSGEYFTENCRQETCFLRLNRYPPCPLSPEIFGLTPHTDSDFLTILWQDEVGGLQLMKENEWVTARPKPDSLIVNIGDLFQAWSNDVYRSVEHKVMTNSKLERYSIAYFLCPSYDSTIGSCKEPSPYKKFTFGEYRKQVQEDVKNSGNKIGLPRFLI